MPFDRYQRNINYMRISLTDMCNLRCIYCMPEDMTFRPKKELLQDEEINRLVILFAELGFEKFRLTGGEPTIRENIVDIVGHIAKTPNVQEVAMTTNAILLRLLAKPLTEAGLKRINISIDTLDPKKFKQITRWGNIDDVWGGIDAAEETGLKIKLNCVVVRGFNDQEDVIELARLTQNKSWQVRYIEVMPFGSVADFQKTHIVPEKELRETIGNALGPLTLLNNGKLEGEARIYQLDGAQGKLGFISSVTNPFCAGCNRARLTADGKLRLCLLRDKELDLIPFLREGASDEEIKLHIKNSIWYKPWGHGLAHEVYPHKRVMSEIGG
ncbi:MAG: GTP 3',8-cyclase MoaA [Kiritimatiellae bacterium]|nr:GTP 3',8-cyclase MoaA [Kiritimatiellia bacterium]